MSLVEILYFDGCPHYEGARALVARVSGELGLSPEIRLVRVADVEEAERLRFLGSPTVRVDGHDVEPGAEERQNFVFGCRVYTGMTGVPDEQLVRAALTL
jgi:hypothetical protein